MQTVLLLISILLDCERTGCWPYNVALVLIALLAKTDGGFRLIGLIPTTPRVWMRVRRKVARKWELENARRYLYVGKGMGANLAAWKQVAAAAGEL